MWKKIAQCEMVRQIQKKKKIMGCGQEQRERIASLYNVDRGSLKSYKGTMIFGKYRKISNICKKQNFCHMLGKCLALFVV